MDKQKAKIEIATILKNKRIEAGFTQKQIGDIVGKDYSTVASWEAAKGQPDADIFMKLCDLYGITDILETFGYVDLNINSQDETDEKKEDAHTGTSSNGNEYLVLAQRISNLPEKQRQILLDLTDSLTPPE